MTIDIKNQNKLVYEFREILEKYPYPKLETKEAGEMGISTDLSLVDVNFF